MARYGVVLRYAIASHQLALGDITLSLDSPWNDFRSCPGGIPEPDVFRSDKLHLSDLELLHSRGILSASVSGFLKSVAAAHACSFPLRQTAIARCYRLNNSSDKFEAACADSATREWLKANLIDKDQPGYMIVGIYTFQDTDTVDKSAQGRSAGTVTEHVSIQVDYAHENARAKIYSSPREQIFAVEYRTIEFKWFSHKTIHKAQLSRRNCWQVVWGIRGSRKESDNIEDVVEAILIDEENGDDPGRGFLVEETP